jgi:hypothetical protein
MKPRNRGIGGMARLDRDRKLAKAEMRRNVSVLARTTLVRLAAGGGLSPVSELARPLATDWAALATGGTSKARTRAH